jgi:putative transposase
MTRTRRYPSDLTDKEWAVAAPLLPEPQRPGRPRIHSRRHILDAVFYLLRSGCSWRMLPADFPPWRTVYAAFRRWHQDGTWERLHTALREQTRTRAGRTRQPTAGIVDSQSVKTSEKGGPGATTARSG